MSRSTRILLLLTGCFTMCSVLVCCLGGLVGLVWLAKQITDPQQTAALAAQISDFELPAGYRITSGSTLLSTMTVRIAGPKGTATIWLEQGKTAGLSPDAYLRQTLPYTTYARVSWEAVETRTVTIRGRPTSLTVYTGTRPDNTKLHAWAAAFAGRGGPAKLLIIAPESSWDEPAMQAFIDSLH